MNNAALSTDIIIVGGGPVGLGLAIDLALEGVQSIILERTTKLHQIPKGQNLTQRTGEHFRKWGVTNAIRSATPIPPEFGNAGIIIYEKLLGNYHYDWFQRSKVQEYYFAKNERLPQYELEKVLRKRIQDFPEITFIQNANFIGIEQSENNVHVIYKSNEEQYFLTANYVVGCDGARSQVRDAVGIESATDHEGPKMALLVFRSMELHNLLERHPGKSIFNVMNPDLGGYWQFLGRVDLDGGWFYHAPVPANTTKDNFDFHTYLHEMVGQKFKLEFEHIGFWDLRISLADTYRSERVFIAGDACHSHPPYGGYGVNTGFEDIRNLSWKLNAELKGWAGKNLLESYTTERRPVFESVSQDFIGRMIKDFDSFTANYSPQKSKTEFEAAWTARSEADDADVTEFLPNYAGSPLVFESDGQHSGAKGNHTFRAEPGYHLAPQTLPGDKDLWELLSNGFTLLILKHDKLLSNAFENASLELGVPLNIHSFDCPNLRAAYQTTAILIRPDHFIAWTANSNDVDAVKILSCAIGN